MNQAALPLCIQYLQALGPIVVTVIASAWAIFIQRRMWLNAENKLEKDLFDERYAVYKAVVDANGAIFRSASFDREKLIEFDVATQKAIFLFGDDVNQFIVKFRSKAIFLMVYNDSVIDSSENRADLIDQKFKNLKTMFDDMNKLELMLRPYMNFSSLKT